MLSGLCSASQEENSLASYICRNRHQNHLAFASIRIIKGKKSPACLWKNAQTIFFILVASSSAQLIGRKLFLQKYMGTSIQPSYKITGSLSSWLS